MRKKDKKPEEINVNETEKELQQVATTSETTEDVLEEIEPSSETETDEKSEQTEKDTKNVEYVKKNKFARWIIFVVILALIIAAVVGMLNYSPLSTGEEAIEEEWMTPEYIRDKTMNILICGITEDLEYSEKGEPPNTDLIMVANFDIEANKATILQIPRDTYVGDIVYYRKINSIYPWGLLDESGQPTGETGIAPLVETINDQFQLPIDNYVVVSMEGFRQAIDMMGGVEVTIDQAITLGDAESGVKIELEPGTHTFNGEMSDLFVRSRYYYTDADIGRMNVQRYFMAGLLNKLLNMPTSELITLVNGIFPFIETDLSISEVISLAMMGKELPTDAVTVISTPGEHVTDYGRYGDDIWTIHKAALADMLNEYMRPYSDDVPETELGAIEVQNLYDEFDNDISSLDSYENETPPPEPEAEQPTGEESPVTDGEQPTTETDQTTNTEG